MAQAWLKTQIQLLVKVGQQTLKPKFDLKHSATSKKLKRIYVQLCVFLLCARKPLFFHPVWMA